MNRFIATIFHKRRAWIVVIPLTLFFSLILFSGQKTGAADYSVDVPLVGEVIKNFPEEDRLLIKTVDAGRKEIIISQETEFKGVLLLEEIQERQRVKIWLEQIDGVLQAVKIEVMAALGC